MTQSSSSVEQQFAAVTHAPLPFFLVCVVLAGVIWWALNWRFDAKIDRITEERDRYKARHEHEQTEPTVSPEPARSPQTRDMGWQLEFGTVLGHNDDGTLRISNHGEIQPLSSFDILKLMNSLADKTSIKAKDLAQSVIGNAVVVTGNVIDVTEVMDKVSISIALHGGTGQDCYMIFDSDRPRLLRIDKNQHVTVNGIIQSVNFSQLMLNHCDYVQ